MKRSILAFSIAASFVAVSQVNAATLPAGAVLTIESASKFNMGGSSAYPPSCMGGGVSLSGEKGLYVGSGMGDFGSGPHAGSPSPSDKGSVTKQWQYFCNTGVNYISRTVGSTGFSGDTVTGPDMSSWTVGWSGIPAIPMGSILLITPTLTCGSDCSDGDTYTIVHAARVPPGEPFAGVRYDLCLKGSIIGPASLPADTPPVAKNDSRAVATGSMGNNLGRITTNDKEDKLDDAVDRLSIDLDPATAGQQTTVTTALGGTATLTATGTITYDTPIAAAEVTDTFNYTVNDFRGPNTSNIAKVSVGIGNIAPVCNDENGIPDGAFLDVITETFVTIDVLANDWDINGNGTIDVTTVTVVDMPSNGTAIPNPDGTITYTPNIGFEGPTDSFTYEVTDNDASPKTCAKATVNVIVSNAGPAIGPYLVLDTGVVGIDNKVEPALGEGSWFSMELSPGLNTYTAVAGFNHIQIGTVQTGFSPNGPNIDNPWVFFGNLGIHQTTTTLMQLSNNNVGNATLDFSGWDVSWNGIPSIPMGNGADNGIASLTCYTDFAAGTLGTCGAGDAFVLTYRATVPAGDVSGFGGVNYGVHFEGTVSAIAPIVGCAVDETASVTFRSAIGDCSTMSAMVMYPGATAVAAGNKTGFYMPAYDIGVDDPSINPNDGQQCIGGCLDFIVKDVPTVSATQGGEVNFVVKLTADIPEGATYRKLYGGKWQDFDTSGTDAIGSAPIDVATGNCVGPEGTYSIGLRAGNRCLFMRITDGGPNDADGIVNGIIVDPSGVALTGSPNTPEGSSDGCSISKTPVRLTERADWLIVAGFIALMGLVTFKRRDKAAVKRVD